MRRKPEFLYRMTKLATLLLFLLFPLSLLALSNELSFRHFSVEHGLSSNCVRTILQDQYGYMWIGTEEGLNRYDGTEVKNYHHQLGKERGFGENYISALCEIGDKLWVGTDCGVYIYDYASDSFTRLNAVTERGDSIIRPVSNILQDRDGTIWVATDGHGLFHYAPKQERLKRYELNDCMGIIYGLLIDSESRLWAVSTQGSSYLFRFNRAEERFESVNLTYEECGLNARSLVMLEDSKEHLWLGTWECGIQRVDRYTGKTEVYLHPEGDQGIRHIHSIMEYAPNQLLIGSDDGLSLFNTLTGAHTLYTSDELNPNSLSNQFVYPITKDHEGGIWIGTYYGGVNYLSPYAGQFEGYSYSRYTNSVGGNVIARFCEDSMNRIWIASDDGGLSCFYPASGTFVGYMPTKNRNSLSYHNLHALCIEGENLWIGTYTAGVDVFNIRANKFKNYLSDGSDPNGLNGTSSYAIFKDREGRIWITTMSGVNLYRPAEDSFTQVRDLEAMTIDIDQDEKGYLWFSTQNRGLFRYDPSLQNWVHYTAFSSQLASDQVNCVQLTSNGVMWVGTLNGLCKYNSDTDSFERVELEIPSQNICGIVEDGEFLWLTTSKGLVRYRVGEDCQVFTKSDGLLGEQFIPNAAFKASDGKIYIGSVNGFNAFYPHRIRSNSTLPPVVITRLELFNKEVAVGTPLLPESLMDVECLEFSHKENVFSIHFSALSYCTPSKNQYAYRLEGFDKEWNFVGGQTKATYTNLPAGKYIFCVKATNNDGVWNEVGSSLHVVVHPPFYLTKAFMLLYGCLVLLLLLLLIRFLLKRSEKRHTAEIDTIHEQKKKEVHKAKIQFFTMVAHEIRTPVSLIMAPLEKVMQLIEQLPVVVREDLVIIERNSQRLLFLINQLLDFRKIEQGEMKLHCAPIQIDTFLTAICNRFRPSMEQQGILLDLVLPSSELVVVMDAEAMTKVVSNLLTNAKKYTKDYVKVSCELLPNKQSWLLSVVDNGVGVSENEQADIFKPFFQATDSKPGTGLGLSIVKNIVSAHKGFIEVESKPGRGTAFVVTLPMNLAVDVTEVEECNDSLSVEGTGELPLLCSDAKAKPTLLVVDDNKEMVQFLATHFASKFNLLCAENGCEALELLKEHVVNLIISDWMMPKMDGLEFCKELRHNPLISHIPFILLTAKSDVAAKIEGMDMGADLYVEKPFSLQYLESCIKNLMEMRFMLRQKFSKMPLVPLNTIAGNSADEEFLNKMNQLIEENFSNSDLSVDFLAEKMCISRSSLFAKIKALANVTPNELIQVVRLKKAAALLMEKKYRISEVCYMVGFNNPSYFTKCFQKQFGVKPGEFAGKQQEEGIQN